MVLAQTGEDAIVTCSSCDYAANVEKAAGLETCPRCNSGLERRRGIEVGHVFMLGTKYSESMGAVFLDQDGQERVMVMGCYGIGIGRTAAAAIEQSHDDRGMIWPKAIAPFQAHVIPIGARASAAVKAAEELYQSLISSNLEVLLDDRDERPGVKFNDADLIGIPYQVIVGDRGLKEGLAEIKERSSGKVHKTPLDGVPPKLGALLSE